MVVTTFPSAALIGSVQERTGLPSSMGASELLERIQTANLELLLPSKTLQTTAAVKIIGKGFYINGIGLQADLAEQNLRIIKHLETVYTNEQD